MFAITLGAEQRASLHQRKDAPFSGGYPGHDALLVFYDIFQKKSNNFVKTYRTSERFLTETQSYEK
jgi:hypothetical protein